MIIVVDNKLDIFPHALKEFSETFKASLVTMDSRLLCHYPNCEDYREEMKEKYGDGDNCVRAFDDHHPA